MTGEAGRNGSAVVDARAELDHATASGDDGRIVEILDRHLWPLLSEHPGATLAAMAELDDALLADRATLRFGQTVGRTLSGDEPREVTAPGAALFWMNELPDHERDNALAEQMVVARVRGDVLDAVEIAGRLRARVRRRTSADGAPHAQLVPLLWLQLGTTELLAGNTPQAIADLVEARRHPARGRDTARAATAHSALAHGIRGALDECVRLLEECERMPPPPPLLTGDSDRASRLARAIVAVERREPGAGPLLDAADEGAVSDEFWPFRVLARGRHLLADQRPGDTIELTALCRATHRVVPETPAADILAALEVTAFLALDELSAAQDAALEATGSFSRTAGIRLRIRIGDLDRAAAECRRVIADAAVPLDQRSESLLLSVWVALESGAGLEPARALATARAATHGGLRRIFTCVPHAVVREIAAQLPPAERGGFDAAVARLPFIASAPARPRITVRESAVLLALEEHGAVDDMAERLFVSPNTVKTQLRSLYRKLGVNTRAQALAEARRLHLLAPSSEAESEEPARTRPASDTRP